MAKTIVKDSSKIFVVDLNEPQARLMACLVDCVFPSRPWKVVSIIYFSKKGVCSVQYEFLKGKLQPIDHTPEDLEFIREHAETTKRADSQIIIGQP